MGIGHRLSKIEEKLKPGLPEVIIGTPEYVAKETKRFRRKYPHIPLPLIITCEAIEKKCDQTH